MIKFVRKMLSLTVAQAIMPTGKNLVPTLYFAVGIFIMEVIFDILNVPHIMTWSGCLLAVIVLIVILILERSEYNAVSKLYRDAELCIKSFKERQQTARACFKAARDNSLSEDNAGSDE